MRVVLRNQQKQQQKPVNADPQVPRGLRSLPTAGATSLRTNELQDLQQDVAAIERWWKEPRWNHTKRVYSGTLQ